MLKSEKLRKIPDFSILHFIEMIEISRFFPSDNIVAKQEAPGIIDES